MQHVQWINFVDHFMSSISKFVPCHGFFSYELENENCIHSYHFRNITQKSVQNYLEQMYHLDPVFYPHHLNDSNDMLCLQQQEIPHEYQSFLIENEVSDNVELVFNNGNASFRGISLIRSTLQSAFSEQDLKIIESCFTLAKFNFPSYNTTTTLQSIQNTIVITDQLTAKEQQVLEYILQGKKNQDIADAMYISITTVKTHIQHIFQKKQVKNRQELILKSLS